MLVCYHDYTSPASAVAVLRLQRLAGSGLPVSFQGVEILGLAMAIPPSLSLLEELERHTDDAAGEGLALHRPERQPPTAPAHLVGELAEAAGAGDAWREACYRAYWEAGQDIGATRVLVEVAASAGLAPDEVHAALDDPLQVAGLRQRMATLRGQGVGGVPVLDAGGTFVSPFLPEDDLWQLAGLFGAGR